MGVSVYILRSIVSSMNRLNPATVLKPLKEKSLARLTRQRTITINHPHDQPVKHPNNNSSSSYNYPSLRIPTASLNSIRCNVIHTGQFLCSPPGPPKHLRPSETTTLPSISAIIFLSYIFPFLHHLGSCIETNPPIGTTISAQSHPT